MKIVIVRYNAGNTLSVKLAVQRLGFDAVVSDDPQRIKDADKVIFPGQGEASTAMHYLRERGLDALLKELKQPLLGICLGLQLMADSTDENNAGGLGLISGRIKKFPPKRKVPHMGWNTIRGLKGRLFKDVAENSFVYFVHSYYLEPLACTTATTDYILPFSAAVQRDNFYAVQFHPEKSAAVGEHILKNFLTL